jgi:hypothetical protein
MTQLDVRPELHTETQPQALIEEARRRHRRRTRFGALGITVVALLLGGVVAEMSDGGGGSGGTASGHGQGLGPAITPNGGPSHSAPTIAPTHTAPTSGQARANPGTSLASPTTSPGLQTTAHPPTVLASCQSGQLTVAIGQVAGEAGTDYFPLVFTNVGTNTCILQGFPGVSFADANGDQVASAAVRQSGDGSVVSVVPGSSATATAVVLEGAAGDCANGGQDVSPIPVVGFRVYPPNQTAALFAPMEIPANNPLPICTDSPSNTLSIYPFDVRPSSEG